jgi:exonuclease VII small subunit
MYRAVRFLFVTADSLERAISDYNDSKAYRKELEKELYDNRMKCEKLQLERQSLAIDHDREKNAAQVI